MGEIQVRRHIFKTTCSIVCRSEYLTQFSRPGRTECDRCRKEANSTLRSTIGETVLVKGFCFKLGNTKNPYICRRAKLPGRGVHSERIREIDESEKRGR